MQYIYEEIRKVLEETPNKTQKGLAARMGLNPAAVNRMLYGRRNIMAQEIPIIESYLGVKLSISSLPSIDEMRKPQAPLVLPGVRETLKADMSAIIPQKPSVPVYAFSEDFKLCRDSAVDWVPRHPLQNDIQDAFAVYIPFDDAAPRYFKGELVYIHPGRPAEMGRDCFVEEHSGDIQVCRLVERACTHIRFFCYSAGFEKNIPERCIKSILPIISRG